MAHVASAGVLAFRWRDGAPELLLGHPGGPFWKSKDAGAWSIPKGLVGEGEDLLAAGRREFGEEIGLKVDGDFVELTPVRMKSGKVVHCWMVEADFDVTEVTSNRFEMEWPPRSGKTASFPEIDRAAYFAPTEALEKVLAGQRQILVEALGRLGWRNGPDPV